MEKFYLEEGRLTISKRGYLYGREKFQENNMVIKITINAKYSTLYGLMVQKSADNCGWLR